MKKTGLAFVPSVGLSHLVPTLQFAKRLISLDNSLSVTFLIMPQHFTTQTRDFIQSLSGADDTNTIRFIYLPPVDLPPPETEPGIPTLSISVENHKPDITNTLAQLHSPPTAPLAALVVDMFTTAIIDIATDLGVPSYIYFTSGAAMVGVMLHIPTLDNLFTTKTKFEGELLLPSFVNPVPALALPSIFQDKSREGYRWVLKIAHNFRQAKGIIVNSAAELESHAVGSIVTPKLYPVGPLLAVENRPDQKNNKIIEWLDKQPPCSVIFICFGSRGTLSEAQVKELAKGLERSGHRFLWSLRQPAKERFEPPTDYENLEEVLPQGFLERSKERGLVCGWAPQVEVLGHQATGGFVSHCGWNSILESLWFGVPILTWPLDAEQKMNAFLLVRELGLGVGIKDEEDYGDGMRMGAEIEDGVRCLMEEGGIGNGCQVRMRVKEVGNECRKAVQESGSSFSSLHTLIHDLVATVKP